MSNLAVHVEELLKLFLKYVAKVSIVLCSSIRTLLLTKCIVMFNACGISRMLYACKINSL